ncbi:alpha/beta hydrolase [Chromobacterium vaccinii]|uniref:alpha/beta hydrolase n=1 Tax=Chromobacterium vaccinii TaxID=1108595 RepID=UPI00131A3C75|nr:alpha/beta hydrolase [Chromobacterium vaccinii]
MKVTLCFVPPGGGENDYCLEMEMPAVPQRGDYISIQRNGQTGLEDFIVRRTWWGFECTDEGKQGRTTDITVECEFAKGPFSSESHTRACSRYDAPEFENTMY